MPNSNRIAIGRSALANIWRNRPLLTLGGAPTIYGDKCYPGPIGSTSPIQIVAGSETKVDFTLERVPSVHVRGFVFGLPQGIGVGVTLVKREASQSFAADRSASSRPDGAFDIAGVAPGSYLLIANRTDATGI